MTTPVAIALMPDLLFLDESGVKHPLCAAIGTYVKAGAGAKVTVTIGDHYPAIKRAIPFPVISIIKIPTEAASTAAGIEFYTPDNMTKRGTGVGYDPDGAGEFNITGNRTIDIWDLTNKDGICIIIYVPDGYGTLGTLDDGTTILYFPDMNIEPLAFGIGTFTGAAGAAVTVTLPSSNPPIKQRIQSPILAAVSLTKNAVTDTQHFMPNHQKARATAPAAGEDWQLTGARTFKIWDAKNEDGMVLTWYVPDGFTNI